MGHSMICKRVLNPPLYYHTAELATPSRANFYARLQAAVKDWEPLAAAFRPAFCEREGRPTDPVVYLKIFLIAYFENILYDTDLAERISDSLALRAFLGYDLTEQPPDHSSISRVRSKIAAHCDIDEVLEQAVGQCIAAGLVSGEMAAVDASLLPANASLSSLRSLTTGKSLRAHSKEVWERNRALPEGEKPEKIPLSNTEFRSTTDSEARVAHKPRQPRRMCYQLTHVTDAQDQVILAAACGLADRGEAEAAKAPLQRAQETLADGGLTLGVVSADKGYDDAKFHAYVEGLGATPVTHTQQEGTEKPKGFRKSDFTYLPEQDCYQCPASQELPLRKRHQHRLEYRAEVRACQACPHREACVGETKGGSRSIWRVPEEASRERNQARARTEEGRALLALRGRIVEAPFGHLKTYGGMARINCRGQGKANVKVVLAAVAWDLLKLVEAVCGPLLPRTQKHCGKAELRPPGALAAVQEARSCLGTSLRRVLNAPPFAVTNRCNCRRLLRGTIARPLPQGVLR
jgi:transposase